MDIARVLRQAVLYLEERANEAESSGRRGEVRRAIRVLQGEADRLEGTTTLSRPYRSHKVRRYGKSGS